MCASTCADNSLSVCTAAVSSAPQTLHREQKDLQALIPKSKLNGLTPPFLYGAAEAVHLYTDRQEVCSEDAMIPS